MNFHFTPNAGKDESALWSANDPRLLQISSGIGFAGAGTVPDSGDSV